MDIHRGKHCSTQVVLSQVHPVLGPTTGPPPRSLGGPSLPQAHPSLPNVHRLPWANPNNRCASPTAAQGWPLGITSPDIHCDPPFLWSGNLRKVQKTEAISVLALPYPGVCARTRVAHKCRSPGGEEPVIDATPHHATPRYPLLTAPAVRREACSAAVY